MSDLAERPLGGPIVTPAGTVVLALAAAMFAYVAVRVFTGLGPITALNDGYPWGLWKPLNVVTFTGIGAGALGLALVAYVANRGQYHPLVRSAVLVGAIAYTLAGFSVLVDLGRWWNVWELCRALHLSRAARARAVVPSQPGVCLLGRAARRRRGRALPVRHLSRGVQSRSGLEVLPLRR